MRAVKIGEVVGPHAALVGVAQQLLESRRGPARVWLDWRCRRGCRCPCRRGKISNPFCPAAPARTDHEIFAARLSAAASCEPSQDAADAEGGLLEEFAALDFHGFWDSANSRSVFKRNCPHAASMSPPFLAAQRGGDVLLFQRGEKTFADFFVRPFPRQAFDLVVGNQIHLARKVFWRARRAAGFAPANRSRRRSKYIQA